MTPRAGPAQGRAGSSYRLDPASFSRAAEVAGSVAEVLTSEGGAVCLFYDRVRD